MEVPCGPATTFASFMVGCGADQYQRIRFVQTQIALDEAIIAVTFDLFSCMKKISFPIRVCSSQRRVSNK